MVIVAGVQIRVGEVWVGGRKGGHLFLYKLTTKQQEALDGMEVYESAPRVYLSKVERDSINSFAKGGELKNAQPYSVDLLEEEEDKYNLGEYEWKH